MKFLILGLSLAILVFAATLPAQYDAAIFSSTGASPYSGYLALVNMARGTLTTVWTLPGMTSTTSQRTRGGVFGPDGLVYVGLWDHNGAGVVDPKTGAWIRYVVDHCNCVLGAPYQPAPNHDNVGGFGLCCIDGNVPPAPAPQSPSTTLRNTALIDFGLGRYAFDGWFPNTETDMSDFYPNLFKPGTFVGIPYGTADLTVTEYPLAPNPPQALALTTIVAISSQCYYDACWAEDGFIYAWGGSTVGFHQIDVRGKSSTVIPVTGMTTTTYAAVWNEPWERPGMKAHILSRADSTAYTLDLLARPIAAVKTTVLLPTAAGGAVNSAREAEEAQLSSWWTGAKPGERDFHLNFGPAHGGETAVLVPSRSGLARTPFVFGGLEIYLTLDTLTIVGFSGLLPYPPVAVLDSSGQADVIWKGFGARLGVTAYWQAVSLKGAALTDASNLIHVNM